MAELDVDIAGRRYRVACRDGEEDNLRAAVAIVDAKSREALAGMGALSEARQLLFASLLIADQLIDKVGVQAPQPLMPPDPQVVRRVDALAERLERLAGSLEKTAAAP
ncbi:cell division protein ZapA [Sphingomonas sp. BN140010]|uniref:Cell division protein ZapA n=1 Tax=Sphingomonas arvum TaxID=2992113 RepID=A0ABT3JEV1_9SPHN|nr:cell division protein ZapA [Sphingomonas sp. BN140010]MCW3797305.1 cell division protein ZapA [Sphingomonas sp. BN140010]